MKRRIFYISIGILTFIVGVYFAFINLYPQQSIEVFDSVNSPESQSNALPQEKLSGDESYFYEDDKTRTLHKLNALVKYKNRKGKQTIYLSKELDFAYWVEDKALYYLPKLEQPEHIDWFFESSRIDLTKQIVPTGKYGFLGCCLYEKDWADKTISKCKKGRKIIL